MVDWTYNPEDYGKQNLIPEGIYRVRIEEARERVSKSGKDMYELVIKVSGQQSKVWYYLVFDGSTPERQQQTNNKLGAIFDSFDIPRGDLNLEHWKGKVGAARIRHRPDQNEELRADVHFFVKRQKQDELPVWQEHPNVGEMASIDDVPF